MRFGGRDGEKSGFYCSRLHIEGAVFNLLRSLSFLSLHFALFSSLFILFSYLFFLISLFVQFDYYIYSPLALFPRLVELLQLFFDALHVEAVHVDELLPREQFKRENKEKESVVRKER